MDCNVGYPPVLPSLMYILLRTLIIFFANVAANSKNDFDFGCGFISVASVPPVVA